ncbi:MAG: serine/threonine-protein kinase [Planctomycetota bacterium]|jgi:serine/threonine protein kinase/tetratricopeptide (TPR) repeat protein|nr:serine/threonine-protein kinase [Planctomycetota bacterium]MDP6761932.1 serine/threonine-protein kinase [Planctomycetota bacterium]MDP6989323.1 serine/threonine-protein kinase [Planctomycetota bacterium]
MRFAHFEFDPERDRLGEGPLSEVYKATDVELGRTVALKILRAHAEIDPKADERFHREARHASNLSDENIATVFEYGKDQGTSFIVMEYLAGRTLDKVLKDQLLGYEECRKIATQTTSALKTVHASGVIHRDLKPANIMLLDDGMVKLLDFGIARASNESGITQHGMLVGTVLYMSPEQVRGDDLTKASDIFSLGSVLYHVMTGALPFPGKSFPEVCMGILDGSPRRPSHIRQGFPLQLEEFILRCLRARPEERFQSAAEALGALQAVNASARTGGTEPAALDARLLLPPTTCGESERECAVIAGGLRKDLATELTRLKGVDVALRESDDIGEGEEFDYVLRTALEVKSPHGKLVLNLERWAPDRSRDASRESTRDLVEESDSNEWSLQADLVRTAVRRVKKRLTEFSLTPSEGSLRDKARALRLARHAHDQLLRGTTKHLMAAIHRFRSAIEADRYCAKAHAGLAEAMVRKYLYWDGDTGYLAEAREHAHHALALDPDCAEAHTSLGFAYHLSGQSTEAQREYRLAIGCDETEWLAHRLLGAVLARGGNFENAEPHLQRASTLQPSHIGSFDHLYCVLKRLERHEEAEELARQGIESAREEIERNPDNQEARLHMALLLGRTGEHEEARETVEAALSVSPKDGYTSYNSGCVLAVIGEVPGALDQLENAHARGFYISSELLNNTDLELLRGTPEFEALVG